MTTTDRTKMPTDELMGKVVAKWKGYEYGRYSEDTDGWVSKDYDARINTDAALELLHYVNLQDERANGAAYITAYKHDWGLVSEEPDGPHRIGSFPISGEGFRLGVCWLAVDVLGVDND